jgi:hypothetical protein
MGQTELTNEALALEKLFNSSETLQSTFEALEKITTFTAHEKDESQS